MSERVSERAGQHGVEGGEEGEGRGGEGEGEGEGEGSKSSPFLSRVETAWGPQ